MPPLRTGLLSFGLVPIPVQLYTAIQDQRIAFNLLHAKCGSRIQNRYYCPVCNVTVDRGDLVCGYEFAKNQYVQLTNPNWRVLKPNPTSS
jgi:DNA end-binding protein Ku